MDSPLSLLCCLRLALVAGRLLVFTPAFLETHLGVFLGEARARILAFLGCSLRRTLRAPGTAGRAPLLHLTVVNMDMNFFSHAEVLSFDSLIAERG